MSVASITDPQAVVGAIARLFQVQDAGAQSLADSLKQYLAHKHILLLLDNFEQVIAAAPQMADLLLACPHIKLLVTSREALRIRGEREFSLSPSPLPLPVSGPDASRQRAILAANPAVALVLSVPRESICTSC